MAISYPTPQLETQRSPLTLILDEALAQEQQLQVSRAALYTRVFALEETGIIGQAAYEQLVTFNASLDYPLDIEELPIIANYLEGELLPAAPLAEPSPTLDQAIATQDPKAVFACLP